MVKGKKTALVKHKEQERQKANSYLKMSLFVGIIYVIYSIYFWMGVIKNGIDVAAQSGSKLAVVLVALHVATTALAVIFNAIALLKMKRKLALATAILYTAALISFPVYFMFIIVETVLCYMSVSKLPKE